MNKKFEKINQSDFNYSHFGEASSNRYLYLINKDKHLNDLLKGKKRKKIIEDDFVDKEDKDIYDDLYENNDYEEDIFDKDYNFKYKKMLKEQKQKYFNLKKSCSILSNSNIEKIMKEDNNNNNNNSKKRLIDKFNNDKFKYHLIHHHHDYYLEKNLPNLNKLEPECTSYNPKMEYIYKKIIFSPEFKKMSGRYDQDKIRNQIEMEKEKHIKENKEKEYKKNQKKLTKLRASIKEPSKENEIIKRFSQIESNKIDISQRHKSISGNLFLFDKGNNNNNSMMSLFKNISQDKVIYENNDKENNESKNFHRKLFKRTNTVNNIGFSFGAKKNNINNISKNSLDLIKNIEEDENEDNFDEKEKKNLSNNNLEENTLSSAHHNKTISDKRKDRDNSVNYNGNETDIIYPNNISRNDSKININDNFQYNKNEKDKKILKKIKSLNNSQNSEKNSNIFHRNSSNRSYKKSKNNSYIIRKKNILPKFNKKVVNFDKMLSREYVRKLNEKKTNIYVALSPKYESIRPKCIMKVIYAQRKYKIYKNNKFKSDFNELVFDANKNINSYNNHFPPKNIYLDKMTGREINDNNPFPSYMINLYNRNASNTFNEKSYEMNNFANGNLKELKSSFNEKKSFNYKLNEQLLENDNNYLNNEINTIMRKINRRPLNNKRHEYEDYKSHSCSNYLNGILDYNYKYKIYGNNISLRGRIPEYYKVDLDKIGRYPYSGEKIDAITLKTIKNNRSAIELFSDYEKSIFLGKLDE